MDQTSITRRTFLKLGASAMGLYSLSVLPRMTRAKATTTDEFLTGINYPWIAYGHDYGDNGWGHDGLSTSGWTYQTFSNSQGFTDTRHCFNDPQSNTVVAHTGNGALCITANLVGGDPNRAQGEVYLDLDNHAPIGVAAPVNLDNVNVHFWLRLPAGSAGPSSARNGVQLFFKSKGEGNEIFSFYSPWVNIDPAWEDQWHEFTVKLPSKTACQASIFDPTKVSMLGAKVAINANSTATLQGSIYLDDVVLDTNPKITFDFEALEIVKDFDAFQPLCNSPITVVRVFLFADGGASPEFEDDGRVKIGAFDNHFFQDFDILLETAKKKNLMLIPVLLDFAWLDIQRTVNGVKLGGHSDLIRDATKSQTFVDNVLKPLMQKYGSNSQILAWDIINEPEWRMKDVRAELPDGDPVTIKEMQDFVQLCTQAIHNQSSHKVTVGCARRMWLHYWKGLGLDLYQFHWYENMANEDVFPWLPYSELGLDKPCIIGEVPTMTCDHEACDFITAARNGGYAGILVWSYRAKDAFSHYPPLGHCGFLPVITQIDSCN
ncbi:MAG: hypothetical protein U0350_42150 [Caldilineaceae bacterium]